MKKMNLFQNMKNLSPRDRRAVIFGGVGLGVILLLRLLVIPIWDSWSSARDRGEVYGKELVQLNRSLRRALGQRQRLIRMYGPAVSKPLADEQTARIQLFESAKDVFGSGGMNVKNYQHQRTRPLREIPNVSLVTLQVRGQCKLEQLTQCLRKMTNSKSLMIVQSMNLANNEKQLGQLDVTLVLATLADIRKPKTP
jgi:hypothetical protein